MSLLWLLLGITWNPQWTPTLESEVSKYRQFFEKAQDVQDYCPNYTQLNEQQRIKVWSRISIDIAGYESSFDPTQKTYEPSLGVYSIGLFQLSKEDNWSWCNVDNLVDAVENIKCAIPEMAKLIYQDKVIAGGHSLKTAKGLSHYWSSTWNKKPDGHIQEIKADINSFCSGL